jgi:integrase
MKLKHVSKTTRRNANGSKVTYYFYRRPGSRPIALGSDPNSILERWRVLQMQFDAAASVGVRIPGTIADLISKFYQSHDFQRLAPATKSLWRAAYRDLENKFGEFPPDALPVHVVHRWKEKLVAARGRDGARNHFVAFRRLYGYARAAGLFVGENPFSKPGTFGLRIEPDTPKIWTIADIRKFLGAVRTIKKGGNPNLKNSDQIHDRTPPDGIRLALLLGLFTMQRLSDVLNLTGRNIFKDDDGKLWLRVKQRKTKRPVEFPVHKILADELARQKIQPGDDRHLVRSLYGLPMDRQSFYKRFRIWAEAAGLNLTFKALRSSGMVMLAEMGVPTPQITAVSGHSIHEAQRILDYYIVKTRAAARAAVDVMEARLPSLSVQPPVQTNSDRAARPVRRPTKSRKLS